MNWARYIYATARLAPGRWRRVLGVALLFSAAPVLDVFAQLAGGLTVTGVRFWSLTEATRIAVEVSGEFKHRQDRLSNPERIYFDILGARWAEGGTKIHTIPVGDRLVKQIRVAELQPGVTRIVLDLAAAAEFSSAQLANPPRLIIEVRPAGARLAAAAPQPDEPKPGLQAKPAAPPPQPEEPKPALQAKPAAPPPQPEEPKPALQAKPAARDRTGNRSLVRALGLKLSRVVLDPGHGGHDTGAIGPTGLTEKELVLDISQRLGALIEERLGAEVVYTRTEDVYVPLEDRTALANGREADLFLSLHANSGVRSAAGAETYYLNFTTSRAALEVAARENATSQKTIHELRDLIQKIALKDKVDESREFAARIQNALHRELSASNGAARDRGVRKAPFVVLIGASMPSVLVEIAFLSNPREERLLKRPAHRQRVAEALFKGLSDYVSTLSHFKVAAAAR